MGAHPRWEGAALHALLEAIERDQLARALPEAFTAREVRARLVDRRSLGEVAPRAAALAARIEARGFGVFFLDASAPGRRRIALPTFAALLFDVQGGPLPLAAGYACRLAPGEALRAALLEAAQSRATDVHGARDDVRPMDLGEAAELLALCRGARARRRPREAPRAPGRRRGLAAALHALAGAGFESALALDLAPEGFPLRVAKVVVPGLELSELL
jgi:ribosomal protein S12 methylthiotransferase accessory factor